MPPQGQSGSGVSHILQSYCIEVEFLVAVENQGGVYEVFDEETGGPRTARWSCPDPRNPYPVIFRKIQSVLESHGQSVVEYPLRLSVAGLSWEEDEVGGWVMSPAAFARAQVGCPSGYTWIGVNLRSPVLREEPAGSGLPKMPPSLDVLRRAVRMHVNSTCNFNVLLYSSDGPYALEYLKKLASFVWILEPDLLNQLHPAMPLPTRSLTNHAMLRRPHASQDPQSLEVRRASQAHYVELRDLQAQTAIDRIWSYEDRIALAEGLRDRNARPLSFSIHNLTPVGLGRGRAEIGSYQNVIRFRYALWHPYQNLDASEYWIELVLTLAFRASGPVNEYRYILWLLDKILCDAFTDNLNWTVRCHKLLSQLGWENELIEQWANIIHAYRLRGPLSAAELDRHPAL
ncbi:hypothetical protein HIM_07221 [Hirsutella minnesotensis 3608]|uniref:Uncharacterized protein n=1 Tax=Hirsutella minnesotensis 3608 TaxID=1043627 RepID=A0A0F7ZZ14_9HYPO|nr:hypothetical protein HIM_07221 [Hirsutella minnesotensis 3608]